jgi:signal transduction histidine kinase
VQLEASRRRLLTAADTERERIATSIRTDVAVHLQPLPAALTDVEHCLADNPAGAQRALEQLQQSTTRAIDALRRITAGVLPPMLVRRGLGPAVQGHVARFPGLTSVTIDPDLPPRLDPSVETAAYYCTLRAIDSVAPGSQVTLGVADGHLRLTVRGRKIGELGDRQQVLDRVQAIGGQLEEADLGAGDAEVRVALPLDPSAHAAASRRESKSDFLM